MVEDSKYLAIIGVAFLGGGGLGVGGMNILDEDVAQHVPVIMASKADMLYEREIMHLNVRLLICEAGIERD